MCVAVRERLLDAKRRTILYTTRLFLSNLCPLSPPSIQLSSHPHNQLLAFPPRSVFLVPSFRLYLSTRLVESTLELAQQEPQSQTILFDIGARHSRCSHGRVCGYLAVYPVLPAVLAEGYVGFLRSIRFLSFFSSPSAGYNKDHHQSLIS